MKSTREVLPAFNPSAERCNAPRHPPHFGEATLESDIFLEKVPLVDIGRLGFSVRTKVSYPLGCALVLHLAGHSPIYARAVWHARNRLGARFVEPLASEVLFNLTGVG